LETERRKDIRQQIDIKAGKYKKVPRSVGTGSDMLDDVLRLSDTNYRTLLGTKTQTNILGDSVYNQFPEDVKEKIDIELLRWEAIRDQAIKKVYDRLGMKLPEIKKELPPREFENQGVKDWRKKWGANKE